MAGLGMAVMVALTSCEKELTKSPSNAVLEENAFQTETDFQNAIKGIYQRIATLQGYYGGDMIIVPDLLADNLITNANGRGTFLLASRWQYNGDNSFGLFSAGYSIIRAANGVLANIDNGVLSGAVKDNIKGEAQSLRAWVHFDIARAFAKVPTNTINPAVDLGIAYVTGTDPNALPARESIADTYNKIVADLTGALPLVTTSAGTVANGRVNKAAVAGILAKVYLYMGKYGEAVDAATVSLGLNSNVGSRDNLAGIFADATDEGVLFKTKILDKDEITIGVNYSQTGTGGVKSEFVATKDFYDMYGANDVRKDVYFQVSPYQGVDQIHVAKYFGRVTGNVNTVDAKVLRVADVLLIRAEANARLGNLAPALADLNALKSQRYFPYVAFAGTLNQTLAEILKERRLELAFEGDRFFDLKRLNLPVVRNPNYGDKADGSGTKFPSYALTLPAGDHRFELPIPQTEINVNSNFKQNPGY
jgi:starch-binding outer membrane protein, SusD/RagB family